MVAGYDPSGPALYYVDSDGQRTKGQIFSVGSGSLYAYGVLDAGYKWCVLCPLRILHINLSISLHTKTTPARAGIQVLNAHVRAACEGTWRLRMPSSSAGGVSTMQPSVTPSVEEQ